MAPNKLFSSVSSDVATLGKQVDNLLTTVNTMANDMQIALVGLVVFASEGYPKIGGNIDLLKKLDAGLGKGDITPIHRASMRAWVIKNGPCAWSPKSKDKAASFSFSKDKAKALAEEIAKDKDACINRLMKTPWFEARKESDEFTGFDLDKKIASLIKLAHRMAIEHEDEVGGTVKIDRLPALERLLDGKAKNKITAAPNAALN